MDILFLVVVIGFFAGAIAYVEGCEGCDAMTLEFWLGGTVAVGILLYLFYVLLNPEKF